jgi:hypothetical protein
MSTKSERMNDLKSVRVDLTPRGLRYLRRLDDRSRTSLSNAREKRPDDLVRLLRAIEARVVGTIS